MQARVVQPLQIRIVRSTLLKCDEAEENNKESAVYFVGNFKQNVCVHEVF